MYIDGVLYNYRISCFTNFTGNEKKTVYKSKSTYFNDKFYISKCRKL